MLKVEQITARKIANGYLATLVTRHSAREDDVTVQDYYFETPDQVGSFVKMNLEVTK